jgi:hypothetical protein
MATAAPAQPTTVLMSALDDDYDPIDNMDDILLRQLMHASPSGAVLEESMKANLRDRFFFNKFNNILDLSDVAPKQSGS